MTPTPDPAPDTRRARRPQRRPRRTARPTPSSSSHDSTAPRSPWRATLTVALTATLLAPICVPAALGVDTVVGYWNNAPSQLPDLPLSEPSVIRTADGTVLATVFLYNRDVVDRDEISDLIADALVATEDARFYDHPGVDTRGIARALLVNAKGGDQEGGSTLTQQVVKMTLEGAGRDVGDEDLAAAATENSVWRKLREAKLALSLEDELTKDEILTRYLNLAYFGAGAYGVQAAAQRYFSVDATDVSVPQAALLVALVNNPSRLDPTVNPDGALKRRNLVLDRMATAGVISAAEHDQAVATDLALAESRPNNGCANGPAPMFCDWVRTELENEPALGASVTERRARLAHGGLTITTTLDMGLQTVAQAGVDAHVPSSGDVVATQVLVEPGTGNVRAMVTTRPYGTEPGQSVMPLATTPAFQPGSTFKAFTLLAALEAKVPLSTRLPGGDRHTSTVFDNPKDGYYVNSGDGYGRNLDLRGATQHSVNTAFVQLQELVGTAPVAQAANRAGITSLDPATVSDREGSLTLGARETSPLQVANAYATIAAHGLACVPRSVTSIVDSSGTELVTYGPSCTQQFSPAVADTVSWLLESVVAPGGTGSAAAIEGHPVAGKTGTTQSFGAAWFAGFTPSLSSAVWVGDPRGPSHPMTNVLGYDKVYGGTIPAEIFASTFTAALAGQPAQALPGENSTYLVTPRPSIEEPAAR